MYFKRLNRDCVIVFIVYDVDIGSVPFAYFSHFWGGVKMTLWTHFQQYANAIVIFCMSIEFMLVTAQVKGKKWIVWYWPKITLTKSKLYTCTHAFEGHSSSLNKKFTIAEA